MQAFSFQYGQDIGHSSCHHAYLGQREIWTAIRTHSTHKRVSILSPDTTHIPFAHRKLHIEVAAIATGNDLQLDSAACIL